MPLTLALSAIAAATAPAATLMVVRQYKANGPVTKMLLPVVAMDDALGLILYAVLMALARTIDRGTALTVWTLVFQPLIQIVGSLGLGVVLGLVLVYVLRFFHSRGNKLALTIMMVFAGVGLCSLLDWSSLLCCMMIRCDHGEPVQSETLLCWSNATALRRRCSCCSLCLVVRILICRCCQLSV